MSIRRSRNTIILLTKILNQLTPTITCWCPGDTRLCAAVCCIGAAALVVNCCGKALVVTVGWGCLLATIMECCAWSNSILDSSLSLASFSNMTTAWLIVSVRFKGWCWTWRVGIDGKASLSFPAFLFLFPGASEKWYNWLLCCMKLVGSSFSNILDRRSIATDISWRRFFSRSF